MLGWTLDKFVKKINISFRYCRIIRIGIQNKKECDIIPFKSSNFIYKLLSNMERVGFFFLRKFKEKRENRKAAYILE